MSLFADASGDHGWGSFGQADGCKPSGHQNEISHDIAWKEPFATLYCSGSKFLGTYVETQENIISL